MAIKDSRTSRSAAARTRAATGSRRAVEPQEKRSYDSTRRQAAAAERQRQVLEVAARRFAADGWTQTTVADVATEAGVSPELIFRKIGGKSGLLLGAVEQRSSGSAPDVRSAVKALGLDAEPKLAKRIASFVAFTMTTLDATAPLVPALQNAADQDPEARAMVKEIQQRRRGTARQVVGLLVGAKVKTPPELADELYVLTSADTFLQFTRESGWSRKRYAEWLEVSLREALARHGVTR